MEKRFVCGNKQVHEGQWRVLVTRWDAAKNQEVAETNTANRQQLKLHQTTGTKTYAQLQYQWERQHPGEVLDRVTFFALAYDGNKKDLANPQLSNEEAQKKYDKLQELENIVRNEGREVTHEVRNELFNKVMGPEKRNRVRGYGIGAKWADVPGILTQKSGVTHQLKALSESYEAHRESSEKREEILTQQLKECAEREEAMRADFVQLNKKLDALQAQMVPNPLTQILAADGKASMEKLDLRRLIDLLTKADNFQDMSTSNVEMGNNTSQNCTT